MSAKESLQEEIRLKQQNLELMKMIENDIMPEIQSLDKEIAILNDVVSVRCLIISIIVLSTKNGNGGFAPGQC